MNTFKYIICSICLSIGLSLPLHAQLEISWEQLSEVNYTIKNKNSEHMGWSKPKFGDSLKELAGKQVKITGYMLPITVDRKEYILSQFHFSECFFCGNGGPETVMELKLDKEIKKVILDKPVSFEGILRLNKKPYELVFFLENARMTK